jgi:hypothetical protein
MLFKPFAIFATVLGVVRAEHPTSQVTFEPSSWFFDDCPTPLNVQCDTNPTTLIPQKTTLKLEDYGATVIATLSCEKEFSRAQACVFPVEDGGVAITIADSYGGPFCWNEVFFTEGVKHYKSTCRGRDFKVKVCSSVFWLPLICFFR